MLWKLIESCGLFDRATGILGRCEWAGGDLTTVKFLAAIKLIFIDISKGCCQFCLICGISLINILENGKMSGTLVNHVQH